MFQAKDDAKRLQTTDPREIVKIFTSAMLDESHVHVRLDHGMVEYFSLFRSSADELEALQSADHLTLTPLDPPVGNAKIRLCERVMLRFFTAQFSAECQCTFLETQDNRSIHLSLPERLTLIPQRRADVRVKIDEKKPFILKIIRPSGISFLAKPIDISAGGISFASIGNVPHISEKSRIHLILDWKNEGIHIKVRALMLKEINKEGEQLLRARFLPESLAAAQSIEELVALVQRKHLQQRAELFS
ncbi:type IV pilus assembly PilZ [Magnetococcus marinus MC-1]|uniref:Type IV pilus assembly PilZ n=1 Tax=Magnetococcus marinus (strain ATCC BAA-1437 / JCM 17883 / MC-1) TaxID=156889 RepID=A0LC25_MAGMM|nr:PilZ domain-containing protein [Magnetococcus marinus]ABK45518.1 type IV pilus assembly PilZ [Magnetococcus marinus MC-1]